MTNDLLTIVTVASGVALVLFKVIDYSITWWKLQQRTYSVFELLKLDRKEPQRKVWRTNNVVTLVSFMILVYDGFFVKALIESWHSIQLNGGWILLLLMFFFFAVVVPIVLFYDGLVGMLMKQTNTKSSATLEVKAEGSSIFRHCQIILLNMGATLISLDSDSKTIVAQFKRYKVFVQVRRSSDESCSSVLVESDTQIPTIIDFGGKKRTIDDFIRGFYELKH